MTALLTMALQMAFEFSESDMPCDTGYCFI